MSTATTQRPYVVGIFEDHYKADAAIADLIAAGFSTKEIGTAVRSDHEKLGEDEKAQAYGEAALSRTTAGAVTGAVLGGTLGAIASLLIPGFGTLLLTGILVMAAGGGIAGGFAGLISTMQLSEEEKHYYHQELLRGRCLVFVKAGDRYSEAVAILESHGAIDVTRRPEAAPASR
jgi:hypothetical protein